MDLTNSKRLQYTANYVTTQLTPEQQKNVESKPGGGYIKANMLRMVGLTIRDLEQLSSAIDSSENVEHRVELKKIFSIVKKIAQSDNRTPTMEVAASIAPISYAAMDLFFKLSTIDKDTTPFTQYLLAWNEQRRKIFPIGRLHLERIEMYPAGIQKGELVFTVPMAPGETVTISHKEWSTSSREFEEIVNDYFESYSEKGVAEKTDVSMSTENESKHSSAINFGASLSGSYAGVTLTTTFGIAATNEERESVKKSIQKNREVTEKASARTRKEHKVSVKLETKTGSEDSSFKTFTNDTTKARRIDYYRMMRKWRTDLYRYGLRQTYDIAIPLPGVRIWALHQRLAEIEKKLKTPFVFALKSEDLNNANWTVKAMEFGAPAGAVPPPPDELILASPSFTIEHFGEDDSKIGRYGKIDFEVPAGYKLSTAQAVATLQVWPTWGFQWLNGNTHGNLVTHIINGDLADLRERTGAMSATYFYRGISFGSLTILFTFGRKLETFRAWQHAAWTAIKASAEARYQEQLAVIKQEYDKLWQLLNGKDTLSLRRLEREELVRLVMQWLLGPSYPVVSSPGNGIFTAPGHEISRQLLKNEIEFQNGSTTNPTAPNFNPTFKGVTENNWFQSILFGESVKFIHQAIEWENLLYFLYPYFWGSEEIGKDKLLFEHIDPEHERFLRAGYARIVLTIRPGFEENFTKLMEEGSLKGTSSQPYITAAQEIANFARTNYAGIPPANPELQARPLLFPEQRATWDTMQKVMSDIDTFKATNGSYPEKLDDLPSGLPKDAWGNPFVYRLPGFGADYDLISLGADNEEGGEGLDADISSAAGASLVATWNDYTPTSAIDIEVDTKLEDIA